jgi:hypothetical protein
MLIQYVKDKKGRRVGVVIGMMYKNQPVVGWSKCNIKKDRFDKEMGQTIACGRAIKGSRVKIPHCIIPYLAMMRNRASKYFVSNTV